MQPAEQWLILTDYASKYRVSVSTLRRRIKNGTIQFRFESGRYFIFDAPPKSQEQPAVYRETLTFPGLRPVAAPGFQMPVSSAAQQKSASVRASQLSEDQAATQATLTDIHKDMTSEQPYREVLMPAMTTQPVEHLGSGYSPTYAVSSFGEERTVQGPFGGAVGSQQEALMEETMISSATRMLAELKRAYMNILQEKETQIIQLKEEVTDLKTLVRVLEDDNDRMRRVLTSPRI